MIRPSVGDIVVIVQAQRMHTLKVTDNGIIPGDPWPSPNLFGTSPMTGKPHCFATEEIIQHLKVSRAS